MRIAEIESKIEKGDCSQETIEMFKTALKRVSKEGRCQHCYSTAIAMPEKFNKQAIALIEYGLSEHYNSWIDGMRGYYNMARIYENISDYQSAQENYNKAFLSIIDDKKSSYAPEYYSHLMRTELHINSFLYTEILEEYYNIAIQADEFSKSFMIKRFYQLIAEIIIFKENRENQKANEAYLNAKEMLKPNYFGSLTAHLKKHKITETVGATKEAKNFLKKAETWF